MNYYGQPRMTRDIDIVVELEPADAERVTRFFSTGFYIDTDAVAEAIRARRMFNAIHGRLVVKVDFIVRKDTPYRREELSRRRSLRIDDLTVSVVSPEDLLLSKLAWAADSRSEIQLDDARNLIASVPELDWSYIETRAATLGVEALLREVRG